MLHQHPDRVCPPLLDPLDQHIRPITHLVGDAADAGPRLVRDPSGAAHRDRNRRLAHLGTLGDVFKRDRQRAAPIPRPAMADTFTPAVPLLRRGV